ncbi:DJ-1/PfpI family protein [Gracilibacillus salitolerans]|uniref:DJ-1/PfpI family protein n=1 Tax=Gracilibacillus salitolerans TaxID=2663022 RepID=A0A5Q2TTR3_9BACI|nr:DJ-1/PfpI family protein [Gracilibacillus salitolerans]QGH37040.1 DJ-1/PfpI family protein [Gracilibacillus salitolerans]
MSQRTVGILLFNEVEVLDFAGPFEVFSLTSTSKTELETKLFNVITISEDGEMIKARNGLKVSPDYNLHNHPALDILVVPGGYGAEEIEINNSSLIEWIKQQYSQVDCMTSVCTGALLLAKAGLLNGRKATTHWMDQDRLEKEFPLVAVQRNVKFVDEDNVITSGGISAGIDMSFHLISRIYGRKVAEETAKRMEYDIFSKDRS